MNCCCFGVSCEHYFRDLVSWFFYASSEFESVAA
jgi:hypothetical protein